MSSNYKSFSFKQRFKGIRSSNSNMIANLIKLLLISAIGPLSNVSNVSFTSALHLPDQRSNTAASDSEPRPSNNINILRPPPNYFARPQMSPRDQAQAAPESDGDHVNVVASQSEVHEAQSQIEPESTTVVTVERAEPDMVAERVQETEEAVSSLQAVPAHNHETQNQIQRSSENLEIEPNNLPCQTQQSQTQSRPEGQAVSDGEISDNGTQSEATVSSGLRDERNEPDDHRPKCAICLEFFTEDDEESEYQIRRANPSIFMHQCGHHNRHCKKCINNWIIDRDTRRLPYTCPLCRREGLDVTAALADAQAELRLEIESRPIRLPPGVNCMVFDLRRDGERQRELNNEIAGLIDIINGREPLSYNRSAQNQGEPNNSDHQYVNGDRNEPNMAPNAPNVNTHNINSNSNNYTDQHGESDFFADRVNAALNELFNGTNQDNPESDPSRFPRPRDILEFVNDIIRANTLVPDVHVPPQEINRVNENASNPNNIYLTPYTERNRTEIQNHLQNRLNPTNNPAIDNILVIAVLYGLFGSFGSEHSSMSPPPPAAARNIVDNIWSGLINNFGDYLYQSGPVARNFARGFCAPVLDRYADQMDITHATLPLSTLMAVFSTVNGTATNLNPAANPADNIQTIVSGFSEFLTRIDNLTDLFDADGRGGERLIGLFFGRGIDNRIRDRNRERERQNRNNGGNSTNNYNPNGSQNFQGESAARQEVNPPLSTIGGESGNRATNSLHDDDNSNVTYNNLLHRVQLPRPGTISKPDFFRNRDDRPQLTINSTPSPTLASISNTIPINRTNTVTRRLRTRSNTIITSNRPEPEQTLRVTSSDDQLSHHSSVISPYESDPEELNHDSNHVPSDYVIVTNNSSRNFDTPQPVRFLANNNYDYTKAPLYTVDNTHLHKSFAPVTEHCHNFRIATPNSTGATPGLTGPDDIDDVVIDNGLTNEIINNDATPDSVTDSSNNSSQNQSQGSGSIIDNFQNNDNHDDSDLVLRTQNSEYQVAPVLPTLGLSSNISNDNTGNSISNTAMSDSEVIVNNRVPDDDHVSDNQTSNGNTNSDAPNLSMINSTEGSYNINNVDDNSNSNPHILSETPPGPRPSVQIQNQIMSDDNIIRVPALPQNFDDGASAEQEPPRNNNLWVTVPNMSLYQLRRLNTIIFDIRRRGEVNMNTIISIRNSSSNGIFQRASSNFNYIIDYYNLRESNHTADELRRYLDMHYDAEEAESNENPNSNSESGLRNVTTVTDHSSESHQVQQQSYSTILVYNDVNHAFTPILLYGVRLYQFNSFGLPRPSRLNRNITTQSHGSLGGPTGPPQRAVPGPKSSPSQNFYQHVLDESSTRIHSISTFLRDLAEQAHQGRIDRLFNTVRDVVREPESVFGRYMDPVGPGPHNRGRVLQGPDEAEILCGLNLNRNSNTNDISTNLNLNPGPGPNPGPHSLNLNSNTTESESIISQSDNVNIDHTADIINTAHSNVVIESDALTQSRQPNRIVSSAPPNQGETRPTSSNIIASLNRWRQNQRQTQRQSQNGENISNLNDVVNHATSTVDSESESHLSQTVNDSANIEHNGDSEGALRLVFGNMTPSQREFLNRMILEQRRRDIEVQDGMTLEERRDYIARTSSETEGM